MSEPNRVPLTVRLKPSDKDFFSEAAESSGLEPSIAARQILELVVQRLRSGGDYVDALHELKSTWKAPRQEELERRLRDISAED